MEQNLISKFDQKWLKTEMADFAWRRFSSFLKPWDDSMLVFRRCLKCVCVCSQAHWHWTSLYTLTPSWPIDIKQVQKPATPFRKKIMAEAPRHLRQKNVFWTWHCKRDPFLMHLPVQLTRTIQNKRLEIMREECSIWQANEAITDGAAVFKIQAASGAAIFHDSVWGNEKPLITCFNW